MPTYVILLRAVNVGGYGKLSARPYPPLVSRKSKLISRAAMRSRTQTLLLIRSALPYPALSKNSPALKSK